MLNSWVVRFGIIFINICKFVNLKSNLALKFNKDHYLFLMFFPQIIMPCLSSLLEITALIASLILRECKLAIISSQEDKQGIEFNEGVIKWCTKKCLRYAYQHLRTNDLFIVKELRMRRSWVKLSRLVKSVTKMVPGCLRMQYKKSSYEVWIDRDINHPDIMLLLIIGNT